MKNTDFNRYGIRAAVGYKPNDRFHLDLNLATTLTRNSNGSGNAFSQSGVAAGSAASSLLPPPSMYTASNSALSVFSVQADNQNVVYDASMNIMYLLPFDIRWRSTLGYKYGTVENEKFTPGILNANRATWNNGSEYSYNMYVRSLLSRTVKLGIVNFDLQGGFELSSEKYSGNFIMLNGLASDHIWSSGMPSMAAGKSNFSDKKNTFALIIDPQLSLPGGKYVFTPNIRPEINSSYGSQAKWAINPSLGFRWNFSRESFAKNGSFWMPELFV